MAEKKTTTKKTASKKASKQANPNAVDMVTPVTPADETGLELTEQRVSEEIVGDDTVEELVNPSTDEITQLPGDAEIVFEDMKTVEPKKSVVDADECETVVTDDHDAEACNEGERNQELDLNPEPMFKEDKEMVNDITNILNGLDGVTARKIGVAAEEEEKAKEKSEEKHSVVGKNTTNTEEKNYYSDQFSRAWGGVMYDY